MFNNLLLQEYKNSCDLMIITICYINLLLFMSKQRCSWQNLVTLTHFPFITTNQNHKTLFDFHPLLKYIICCFRLSVHEGIIPNLFKTATWSYSSNRLLSCPGSSARRYSSPAWISVMLGLQCSGSKPTHKV